MTSEDQYYLRFSDVIMLRSLSTTKITQRTSSLCYLDSRYAVWLALKALMTLIAESLVGIRDGMEAKIFESSFIALLVHYLGLTNHSLPAFHPKKVKLPSIKKMYNILRSMNDGTTSGSSLGLKPTK